MEHGDIYSGIYYHLMSSLRCSDVFLLIQRSEKIKFTAISHCGVGYVGISFILKLIPVTLKWIENIICPVLISLMYFSSLGLRTGLKDFRQIRQP